MKLCKCGAEVRARGLCHNHYEQWRKKNPFAPKWPVKKWINPDGSRMECLYPNCESPIRAQGMCQSHLNQFYYQDRKNREK